MPNAFSTPEAAADPRPNLPDLGPEELVELCARWGEKPWRGRQLAAWLYRRGAADLDRMTDLARSFRLKLAERTRLVWPRLETVAEDSEAAKLLWRLSDGLRVESVLIRERDHLTLCLSTQVGCTLGCLFCRSGTLRFARNLTSGEILGQVLGARSLVRPGENLTNLVFMGMGEPLLNPRAVLKSLSVINDPNFLAFGRKRVSLSTAGIVPGLAALPEIGLTISLAAPEDELRDRLMPVNRKYPLAELKKALAARPLARGRRLTIAYVLLKGVNDAPALAVKLSRFLTGLRVKINLIPFNPWPGAPFEASDPAAVAEFQAILLQKGHTATVRLSKGGALSAACGQLAAEAS
ncbi:MAG: 23S rRNA (adenine(2503)-C(2))-methyltransferase RlmN [Deltaproteobacteria bacterium]|nr:23S rRNA (adenine(2503)-C(2))-methyltransferase RlmN [Deltaproteobacteria bacterium]